MKKLIQFKLSILLMTSLILGINTYAQHSNFTGSDHWKTQRSELILGIGISNFLGDLGGLDKTGTHFSPADIEWNTTRPSGHIGYRRRLASWLANNYIFSIWSFKR